VTSVAALPNLPTAGSQSRNVTAVWANADGSSSGKATMTDDLVFALCEPCESARVSIVLSEAHTESSDPLPVQ